MNLRRSPSRRGVLAALALLICAALLPAQTRPPKEDKKKKQAAAAQAKVMRASVARFRARVEATLADAKVEKGHWGVLVVDEKSSETLYALNAQQYFTPASNTKMFTTALALATLGPDYRYRTTVETQATLDQYGRLRGDVVLVGRGDPNLSNRKFPFAKEVERDGPAEKVLAEMADAVVARGVKQIEGDIVADDGYFPTERYPGGWAIDDMTFGYGAPVTALALNDNVLFIEVRPGEREGAPAWFGAEPWAEFYTFVNEVKTGAAGSPRRVWADREPGSRRVTLCGSVPLGAEPFSFSLAVEEPAEYAAALLKRLLEARGVRIYGIARAQHAPAPIPTQLTPPPSTTATNGAQEAAPTVLAEHFSVPLSDALRLINKISQNLHTEILLRTVSKVKTGAGTTDDGLKVAQEFFESIGIEKGDVATRDGSGLSRMNLVTPRAAVKLLQYVAQQPWAAVYLDSLPVAGEDGTLAERMKQTAAMGHVRAKTGTLGNVNALSGFAETRHGQRLIFSMFGNAHNLRGRDSTAVLDAICIVMVEEIGAPPPAPPPAAKKKKK